MLQCGIFENDITPKLGSHMPGYFNIREASGVKEPLRCSAIVFAEDGAVKSVIASADAIHVPPKNNLAARKRIAEKLNVAEAAVTVHGTHIHTGGPVLEGFICSADPEYCSFLEDRIVDCAILASKELRDVRIGFAKGYDDTLANYRDRVQADGSLQTNAGGETKPFGKIDPEITCLVIDNADGSRYGVLVNYACHTDCVGGTELSSDFPGAMRDTLRGAFGADFMPVFVNGFFGNLNHIHFENRAISSRPKYYRSMGVKLAGRVIAAMEDTDYMENPAFRAASETITVKTRMPEPELIAWAEEILAKPEGVPASDMHFAKEVRHVLELGLRDFDLCLQVQKIGDVNIFACPREMFVEFEFMLKEGSDSKKNLCIANANGGCGYVPIKELMKPGIYEARLDAGKLEADAGYKMVDGMLALMKTI